MSDWLDNRWIVAHEPSVEEIADLFAVVDRDLEDASVPRLSDDWRLGIKRNLVNYERAGTTSAAEANEFYEVAVALRADVVRWLRKRHRALCPPGIAP